MSSNWVHALDSLAASGVLDYDVPAYLLDQPARYVGHPAYTDLPMTDISLLPPGTKLKDLPKVDEFNNSNSQSIVQPKKWKKWAFLGAIGTAIGGFILARKGKLKLPSKSTFKNIGTTAWNFIKKPFQWIANKFKRTP